MIESSLSNRSQGRGITTVPTIVTAPSSTTTTITTTSTIAITTATTTSSSTSSTNTNASNSNNNTNSNNNNNNNSYGISAAMAEAGVPADVIDSMMNYGNKMVDQFHERERISSAHREYSDTLYTVNPGQTAYLRHGFTLDDLCHDNEQAGIKVSYDAFARLRVQEHAIDSILDKTRGIQHNAYLDYSELFMSLKSAPAKTLKVIIKSRITSQTPEIPFKVAISIEAQLFSSFSSEFSGSSSLPCQAPSCARRLDLARVFRRIIIASQSGISEWTSAAHRGGRIGVFVHQTMLNLDQNVRIMLELNQTPRVYKLNNQLAQLAHGPTATLQSVISLLWDYGTEYKLFEFNPVNAALTLTCDEYLSTVFNYPVGEKIAWRGIEKSILPTLTEQPPLIVNVPIMFSVPENIISFVVPLMYDNHNELVGNTQKRNKRNKNRNKKNNESGYFGPDNNGMGGDGINENVVTNPVDNAGTDAGASASTNPGDSVSASTNGNNQNDVFMSECMNNVCDFECDECDDEFDECDEFSDYYGADDSRMKGNNGGGVGIGMGGGNDGLSASQKKIESVADAARYFKARKISPFDVSEDNSATSAQLKELDDRLDKVFAEIRERVARRKLYLEFARAPSAAAAKVTAALLRDRGIVAANISGRNPDEVRKSSFYKSHSPYINHTVKTYLTIPMEKRRHKI